MHELRHVKISHHTCILQCTYNHVVCWYFMLHYSGLCNNALRIIWTWTRATQNIWHTMGQVLPAAIRGAFQ